MPTILFDDDGIFAATLILRSGRTVVMPTETVYGIAANALDYEAVSEIFRIKGRPSTNPLIVHVHSIDQAAAIAEVNDRARALAAAFWPGPLTMVLNSLDCVASNVTAGGKTVAVRVPAHPIALKLLKAANFPLAAPSANRSESISPTCVADVVHSLGELSPPVLDGGSCNVGIESTVVDLTGPNVAVLRPGAITASQIEAVLGERVLLGNHTEIKRSPGQMRRHYAPTTLTQLLSLDEAVKSAGSNNGLLHYSTLCDDQSGFVKAIQLPSEPGAYAQGLYAALHELDRLGLDLIVIETPPATEEWLAVTDRVGRAATAISPSE